MNVLTKIRLINELNDKELRLGVVNTSSTWHNQYRDSAWVYVGNLPYDLSEGDVICVLSQYGEIVNINMIREKKTGKSKGFAFVCYEDQRSTVLAVDNLNGTKIKNRQLRVDHVLAYKVPKEDEELDELTQKIHEKGVAPDVMPELEEPTTNEPSPQLVISDASVDEIIETDEKKKKDKKKLSFLKETTSKKSSKVESKYNESDSEYKSHKKKHRSDEDKYFEKKLRKRVSVKTEKRDFSYESDSGQERKKKQKKKRSSDEEKEVSRKKKSGRDKEKRHLGESNSDNEMNKSPKKSYASNDDTLKSKKSSRYEQMHNVNERDCDSERKKSHKKKYTDKESVPYENDEGRHESRGKDYARHEHRHYDRSPDWDVRHKKKRKRETS